MSLFLSFCVSMIKDHHNRVLDKQNTITTCKRWLSFSHTLLYLPHSHSHIRIEAWPYSYRYNRIKRAQKPKVCEIKATKFPNSISKPKAHVFCICTFSCDITAVCSLCKRCIYMFDVLLYCRLTYSFLMHIVHLSWQGLMFLVCQSMVPYGWMQQPHKLNLLDLFFDIT